MTRDTNLYSLFISLCVYELLWKIPQVLNLPFHIICILNSPLLSHSWSERISREVSWILCNILKTIIYIIPCGISLWKNDVIAIAASQTYCYRLIFTPVKCCRILLPTWLLLISVLRAWGNRVFNSYQAMFTIKTKTYQTSLENKKRLISSHYFYWETIPENDSSDSYCLIFSYILEFTAFVILHSSQYAVTNDNVYLSQGRWNTSLGCCLLHPIRIIITYRLCSFLFLQGLVWYLAHWVAGSVAALQAKLKASWFSFSSGHQDT